MAGFEDLFLAREVVVDNQILPLYKEMSIEFEFAETLSRNNDIIVVEGIEAVRVWVFKALKSWRNKYEIYSDSFGTDLYSNIGEVFNEEIRQPLMYADIQETLLVNPYITSVTNFNTVADMENGKVNISFTVNTVYGDFEGVATSV